MSALASTPRITPFLWFDNNAEEAVTFYLQVFPNSRRLDASSRPGARVITISFELDGQRFTALNGGPMYAFNEAISFVIRCESQAELDDYWSKLTADGGKEGRCGWLKDRFGLSWQVVPTQLGELIRNPGALQAMLTMSKIDLATLERAAQHPAAQDPDAATPR